MLKPCELDFEPEGYACFLSPEDRDDLQDLCLEDVICPCWGAVKLRGAWGEDVLVQCTKCHKFWTFELEGGDRWDEYDDEEGGEDE